MNNVCRRGLLGVMAAIPVVAAVKPSSASDPLHQFASSGFIQGEALEFIGERPSPASIKAFRAYSRAQEAALFDLPSKPTTKSDAVAGIEDRTSPSDPFFAPAAASDAEHPILKQARAC